MRKVYLHGSLGEKFGTEFELSIETAAEAVRALGVNIPGFLKEIGQGTWGVVRGETIEKGMSLDIEAISGLRLGKGDLHFVPYVTGSKNSGMMKAILGIALVGISFGFAGMLGGAIAPNLLGATTWGNAIGSIGFAMAISGVSNLLAQQTETQEEDTRSFTSAGPGNTNTEGAIVPIVYGEVITGGVLVSGGLDIEQI